MAAASTPSAGADEPGNGQWITERLADLSRRSRATLRDRFRRVWANAALAMQAGLAAGLAWFIAHNVIGHTTPFFAPIAAVIALAVSVGQRLRRTAELVVGVALGIAVGDLLIWLIGRGPVQIGLIVTLAIVSAIFVGGGSSLITQAASSAVLVATLAPPGGTAYTGRFVDTLVGGGIGLTVMALLLPLNPLTVVTRAAGPALGVLAEGLATAADALEARDVAGIEAVLARLRAGETELRQLQEAVKAASETSALAPVRWRRRGALNQYVEAAEHVARALRNSRVLVRRSILVIGDNEPLPDALPEAVRSLGEAVTWLSRELAGEMEPVATRERALRAASEAGLAYAEGVGFSGSVMVAQVRSAADDLVRASGVPATESRRLVRRAVARSGS